MITRKIGGRRKTDPFAANVKFLALFQGGAGSTLVGDDLTGLHPLTAFNAPTLSQSGSPSVGVSWMLLDDASTQYLRMAHAADLISAGSGYTWEANVSVISSPGANYGPIITLNNTTYNQALMIANQSNTFRIRLVNSAGSDISSLATTRGSSSGTFHIALVEDPGASEWRFYRNGTLQATIAWTETIITPTTYAYIGYSAGGSIVGFDGYIGPVRFTQAVRYTGSSFTMPTLADYLASLTS